MKDPLNTWNLPWQALQRRLAVEPRAASATDSWLGRARAALPRARTVMRHLELSPATLAK